MMEQILSLSKLVSGALSGKEIFLQNYRFVEKLFLS